MVSQFVSEQELAKTYDPEQGWKTVMQFREAKRIRTEQPDLARAEIARRVGRKPSAVRGWLVEDKTPRVVSGIKEARQRGWIDLDSSSEQFRALNQLVAWMFSGGGIADSSFVPHFSIDDQLTLATLHRLLQWMQLPYRVESNRPGHGTLIVPSGAASLFGRVLCVLGASRGSKAMDRDLTLPEYLTALDEEHQRDFLRIYVLNRGHDLRTEDRAGTYLYAMQSETFCQELQELIESVTAGTATIGSHKEVWASSQAVRDLAKGEPVRTALATQAAFGSLTPPTDRAFASTYRKGETPSGYRYLQLYEEFVQSDTSTYKFAKQSDNLQQSSALSWSRGSSPYVKNGIERARKLGWLSPATESGIALGLTSLLAWAFARGSIRADTYYPVFTIGSSSQRECFKDIAGELSLSYEIVRDDRSNRATEARPTEDSAILARILDTLGAPVDKKGPTEYLPPAYLYHFTSHADRFIKTWCEHYGEADHRLRITVPPRLGSRFADGLESLMTDQLSLVVTRINDRELEAEK